MGSCFIGVDVGTGSARAGAFDGRGALLGTASHEVETHREGGGIVEQSSAQIWRAVGAAVRGALSEAGAAPADVGGLGFDATCSLVVLGEGGTPLPVGPSEDPARDVVVWMDHRAVDQARRIDEIGHEVLRYVGGRISPEMQTPKLLWLRENRPAVFDVARQFLDLTDFLTWRATGSLARSCCTVTCKWTYLAHERRWDAGYFRAVGLGALAEEGFRRIGQEVVEPGTPLGSGLTEATAADLGLAPGTPVAAGLIDAHAGGVGTVGARGAPGPLRTMAYVLGTSSCTMTTTEEPAFVPGVWGPYFSAMVPGAWLSEGGQSAAGAAVDHLVAMHPASAEAAGRAAAEGLSLPDWLAGRAAKGGLSEASRLAGGLHVVPEFLGNRAPHADPGARAVVAGLGLERDLHSLVALYVAGLLGLGCGLRQILEAQAAHGAPVGAVAISGGAGRHPLVRQLLADAAGLPVLAARSEEPVLLGSAMLGAVAAGAFGDLREAMPAMSSVAHVDEPAGGAIRTLHDARFRAFERLQATAREIRRPQGAEA